MMRIYSQYTIGGFKIFNLTAFPHTDGNTKYVLMKEIGKAKESDQQEIFVTRNCSCNLDRRIMHFFSNNQVSALILHGCGENKDETSFFLNDSNKNFSLALVSNETSDVEMFVRMASYWLNGGKEEMRDSLQNLVRKFVVGEELAFGFDEEKWNSIKATFANKGIDAKFAEIATGNKNLMANLILDKSQILKSAKIEVPMSSFVTVPGSEYVRVKERNKKLMYYGVGILSAIAIGGVIYYSMNNK